MCNVHPPGLQLQKRYIWAQEDYVREILTEVPFARPLFSSFSTSSLFHSTLSPKP